MTKEPIVTPLAPHQKIMTHIISDIKDYEKYCVSGCSDDPNCVECLKTVFENIYSIFDRYNKESTIYDGTGNAVLDKIRAEIIELRSRQNVGVMECLDIIDKYKAEGSDKE